MGAGASVLRRRWSNLYGGGVSVVFCGGGAVMMWEALTQEGKAAVSVFILIVEAF